METFSAAVEGGGGGKTQKQVGQNKHPPHIIAYLIYKLFFCNKGLQIFHTKAGFEILVIFP